MDENSRCNVGNSTCHVGNGSCKVQAAEGVAYTLLFLLGLGLNVAALWAFMVKRNSWTDTHIYLINLIVADLTLALFLPFRIYDAFYCMPITPLCTVLMSVHYINMYTSILTSTAISVHRFLVVRFPFQARSWRKKKQAAFAVCLAIWTVVVSLCAVFSGANHPSKLWTCFERCENNRQRIPILVLLLTPGFLAPLLVIVFCSSQFIWILRKEDDDSTEKKNMIGIVTANMIIFIVCYTPFHVALLLNKLMVTPPDWCSNIPIQHRYFLVAEWIATSNCCLDFICYYFLLKGFCLVPWRTGVLGRDSRITLSVCD